MGTGDFFIRNARKRGYKIFTWVLVGLGAIIFILGVSFATTNGTRASALKLKASNIQTNDNINYELNVYSKETPIWADTLPGNKTLSPVNFYIKDGDDCATITSKVRSGWYAVFTLKENANGVFYYGRTVQVVATVDSRTVLLNITICIPEDEISFHFDLRNDADDSVTEISAERYLRDRDRHPAYSSYKLNVRLMIGKTIVSGLRYSAYPFDDDVEVELLSSTKGLYIMDGYVQPGAEYNFIVTTDLGTKFNGGQVYSAIYTLKIVD